MINIEVITGPMFSGKTNMLLLRIEAAIHASQRIMILTPTKGEREARSLTDNIKQNQKLSNYPCLWSHAVEDESLLQEIINRHGPDMLVADEAHFFGYEFVDFLEKFVRENKQKNIQIVIAGIDSDAWGRQIGHMGHLMVMAAKIIKLKAVCFNCKGPADKTYKIGSSMRQFEVGDKDKYQARCIVCHDKLFIGPNPHTHM